MRDSQLVPSQRTELRVEIETGEVPIAGHLTDQAGERKAFAGWAQLVSLIERACGAAAGRAESAATAPPVHVPRRNP